MRITGISHTVLAGLALFTQECIQAEQIINVRVRNVAVTSPGILEPAKDLASELFSPIGIDLRWGKSVCVPSEKACCTGKVVRIEMLICAGSEAAYRRFSSDALGYSSPYASSGVRIYVFYERVLKNQRALAIPVLAYVFAHEIAHVLEEECRHSQEGVMKAKWGGADYSQMAVRRLSFTPEDVTLIHTGLARHLARPSADIAMTSNRLQPAK